MFFTSTAAVFIALYAALLFSGYAALYVARRLSPTAHMVVMGGLGALSVAGGVAAFYLDWRAALVAVFVGVVYEGVLYVTGLSQRIAQRFFA